MKRKLLTLLLSALMLCAMLPLSALSVHAKELDGLLYEIGNGGAVVVGYTSEMPANVVVPPVVDGCPVTAIGYGAFDFCDKLCSIVIPASVTTIGSSSYNADTHTHTFATCSNLTSITVAPDNTTFVSRDGVLFNKNMTKLIQYPSNKAGDYSIPDGVQAINEGAFYHCDNLTSLHIPNSVTSITPTSEGLAPKGREGSIYRCTSLTSFTVSESNPSFSSQDGVLFNKTKTRLIQYPSQKEDKEYFIPKGVERIDSWAFYECSNLISVILPDSVYGLGDYTFHCSALTSIQMSIDVSNITDNAIIADITDVYYAAPKWDEDLDGIYNNEIKRIGLLDATWHFDCIEPEDRYSSNVQNSVMDTEQGNGLAYRFELKLNGLQAIKGNHVDFTNATVSYKGQICKVIAMGAVVSNVENHKMELDDVNGSTIIAVPVVYLTDLETNSCAFAIRIINIPDTALERTIYARPYYVIETENGPVTIYGKISSASCTEYM